MKKAKLMLTAVGLLAILGGALAFKANNRLGQYFCTTYTSTLDPQGLPITCSIKATTGQAAPLPGRCAFTTSTTTGSNCNLVTRFGANV